MIFIILNVLYGMKTRRNQKFYKKIKINYKKKHNFFELYKDYLSKFYDLKK